MHRPLRMPGFTAESCVYQAIVHYRTAGSLDSAGAIHRPMIVASQFGGLFDPNCPGSSSRCVDIFCLGLTGAKRAQCIVTCNATPQCGACNCRCSSNCVRTCTQRCCRTTIGPPFRQICCTRNCFKFPDEATQTQLYRMKQSSAFPSSCSDTKSRDCMC
jgi:hypothetical protein